MDLFQKFSIPEPQPFSQQLDLFVAETHNELRLIISHHLNKLGFSKVRTGRDGQLVLTELLNQPADLIVGGDDLASIGGLDLLKELRENPKASRGPFVLLSKSLQKAEVMLAIEAGVDEFMLRPVAPNDILPKLRQAYATFTNRKNPERVYEFAKSKIRDKAVGEARDVYKALCDSAPTAARPWIGLARLDFMEGNLKEALLKANEAITRNANFVHAYAIRAEIHAKNKNIPKALEDFKRAAELSPLNIARYESSCEVLLANHLVDECTTILEMGIAAGLTHPFLIERLGFCYFTKKDYPKALKYLRQAVRLDPESISFLNSLAICFRDAKQYDEAIEVYNQILKKENDNYQVLFNKGLVLVTTERTEEAAKIFQRVLRLNPGFEKARAKLAEIGAGEKGEA